MTKPAAAQAHSSADRQRFNRISLTPHRRATLAELATFPAGSGGIATVMPAATLATLVAMGLAERQPEDRVGGARFAITELGREVVR